MNPLIDLSEIQTERLMKLAEQMTMKMLTASRMNMDSSVINQYKNLIAAYNEELYHRAAVKENQDQDPVVWDMESYISGAVEDEPEIIPRWKRAALSELSNESSNPWDSTDLDSDF